MDLVFGTSPQKVITNSNISRIWGPFNASPCLFWGFQSNDSVIKDFGGSVYIIGGSVRTGTVLLEPKVSDPFLSLGFDEELFQEFFPIDPLIDSRCCEEGADYPIVTDGTPNSKAFRVKRFTLKIFWTLCPPMTELLLVDSAVQIEVTLVSEPYLSWIDFICLNLLNHKVREVESPLNIKLFQELEDLNFIRKE